MTGPSGNQFVLFSLGYIRTLGKTKLFPSESDIKCKLTSKRLRIHSVFKNFHSGERIQKVAGSYTGFTGYV